LISGCVSDVRTAVAMKAPTIAGPRTSNPYILRSIERSLLKS
jgi:hypothetical protein